MNITFIGMAGAGKSHVGKRYAEAHGMNFIDIDREMERQFGKPLQDILVDLGEEEFLQHQAKQIMSLGEIENTVLSPGGSVIYTPAAMSWLKERSKIVYLLVPFELIKSRINTKNRGIVGLEGRTLAELFAERCQLYEEWADVTLSVPVGELDFKTLRI